MKLKDALKLAYKASWYVWCVTLENPKSSVGEIHCIHHCWNDIQGDLHFSDFLYHPGHGMGFEHVSVPIREDTDFDSVRFPGLYMEEEGWTWAYNTENMLKEGFFELAQITARFTEDSKESHRDLWFLQQEVDAINTFCFIHSPHSGGENEFIKKSSEQVSE